jgi:hypothetical protein
MGERFSEVAKRYKRAFYWAWVDRIDWVSNKGVFQYCFC